MCGPSWPQAARAGCLPQVHFSTFYIDLTGAAHRIPTAQLYSNTPSDFDFRLRRSSDKPAAEATSFSSDSEFAAELARTADIVFPVIHGRYGEDGQVQQLLEQHGVPFVGTGAAMAARAFDKVHPRKPHSTDRCHPARCSLRCAASCYCLSAGTTAAPWC